MWYLVDDGLLRGSVTSDRQKYKNLSANPNVSLLIIDPANPQRTIEVRAEAELNADPAKAMLAKFAAAYGIDEAILAAAGEDRYTVTYHPWRIVANPPPRR